MSAGNSHHQKVRERTGEKLHGKLQNAEKSCYIWEVPPCSLLLSTINAVTGICSSEISLGKDQRKKGGGRRIRDNEVII